MLGLPEAAAAHAPDVDNLIIAVHWFMLVLFVGWGLLFIYCLIRFNRKANPRASYHGLQSKSPKLVEAGVVVFEAIILFGLAIPTWGKWVTDFPSADGAERVRVVAEQFAWNFHYPGPDGKFGETDINNIDVETNPLGLIRDSDGGADDVVTINQLYLPVNKPAVLEISSKDVIHSFKVVAMRITQDAIPGLEIPIAFEPTKTGTYEINCAQLCGKGHAAMRGFLNIQTKEEFDKWLAAEVEDAADADDFW